MAFVFDKEKLNAWLTRRDSTSHINPISSATEKSRAKKSRLQKLRKSLWLIDPTCHYCGVVLSLSNATLDHVIPVSRGGKSARRNLVISCKSCNQEKGDGLILTYRRVR